MNVAKLHHIVPQFVLRGFADDNQRITTIRLPARHARTTRLNKTAAESRLYSIPDHPHGSDVFEKGLAAGIEAETAVIFKRVLGGEWPLQGESRDTLAEFLALQSVRGPELPRQMGSMTAELFSKAMGQAGKEAMVEWASQGMRRELRREEVEELWAIVVDPGAVTIPYTPSEHIAMMGEVVEPAAAALASRSWELVFFGQDRLITSDAPVTPIPHKSFGPFLGNGLATAASVLYPMSRLTGLVMHHPMNEADQKADLDSLIDRARSGESDYKSEGDAERAFMINGRVAQHAVSNIYHHPDDSRFVPEEYSERT